MNNKMNFNTLSKAVFLLGVMLLVATCKKDSATTPTPTPTPTPTVSTDFRGISYSGEYKVEQYDPENLPAATELYELEDFSGEVRDQTAADESKANTKIDGSGSHYLLYVQGGPLTNLRTLDYLPVTAQLTPNQWTVVRVHEYQTLYPDFAKDKEITMDEAAGMVAQSAAILFKVAKYLHDQGKKVYILSHSYGSFITPKAIADYKIEDYVEKIIILAGRLQMPKEVYDTFAEGGARTFGLDANGLGRDVNPENENSIPTLASIQEGIDEGYDTLPDGYTVMQYRNLKKSLRKLQASLGQLDFLNIYKNNNIPLDKVYFVTGKKDPAVGYYTDDEIQFAKDNANLYISESAHDVAEDKDLAQYIKWLNE